jgi:hypothetical protein
VNLAGKVRPVDDALFRADNHRCSVVRFQAATSVLAIHEWPQNSVKETSRPHDDLQAGSRFPLFVFARLQSLGLVG